MKKTAVITDAVSPGFFFPRWKKYYGSLFGSQNLHVVTYAGMKPWFQDAGVGNVWEINAPYNNQLRARVIAKLIEVLLNSYDVVLRCDVDEFLIPDLARYYNLVDYVEKNELPYVTARGVDVIELADDAALDAEVPVLGDQRRYGLRTASLNKTCLTTVPLRWAEGFHAADVMPCFSDLYLFHLKFSDLKNRISWNENMLTGLMPDSSEYKNYAIGAQKLTAVQRFFANKPKTGMETEEAFDRRFLDSITCSPTSGIYQGDFIIQDFLFPIDEKFQSADTGLARSVSRETLQRYDHANMADPPEAEGVLKVLEAPKSIPREPPEFVADFSGRGLGLKVSGQQEIHGSYLVRRENVLLFGPNNLVTPEGYWSCEARTFKRQFLWYFHLPFYDRMFPGPKPAIDYKTENLLLRTDNLKDTDVERVDIPVFLATPLEPPIWGRWIVTVAQKVMQYKEYGAGRKFLCHAVHDWQRAFLRLLGVEEDMILAHDPGRTYVCRDLMTVEYSVTNMTVSAMERANFFTMIANHRVKIERKRKIFVSRLSRSRHNPNYRVLQNEVELASMLEELGFTTIEPETLPFEEQISIFAAAEQVVFLGGSGVFNAAFCAPGTSVVTIESSDTYIGHHTELLASLDMRYGVIFGKEDPEDRSDSHKRWTVDVARVRDELMKFFGAG
jgi:hypothetical protein